MKQFGHVSNSMKPIGPITRLGSAENSPGVWRGPWVFGLLLAITTLVAYAPALHGGFVWDDDWWTTRLAGVLHDFSGLRSMWSKVGVLQQYYPLTGSTFWLDYQLWGFRTLPYHIENVLLHACAAFLFWRLLHRLRVPGAWLAASIFALHPVMVESAGWITERKNVLSLVLYLGALFAYGRFARFWHSPVQSSKVEAQNSDFGFSDSTGRRRFAYGLAFLLFLAALLAKTTAFSLPAVIVLLCWWKRGRIRWRDDFLPTLPFLAAAIAFGLVTRWVEINRVGASGRDFTFSFPERFLIAGRALWFYTGKLVWPTNLCFIYPRWQLDALSPGQWLYPAAAVGVLVVLWLGQSRFGRGPVVAALFFAGTLFPLLGFMDAYFMRYSFVCDHWVYLSSLGLIALGVALVARVAERLRAPALLYGFALVTLPVLGTLTWRQSGMYTDIETLWQVTLDRNPDAFLAHNNLGVTLGAKGQWEEAVAHYEKALKICPNYAESHNNLANILLRQGRVGEAIGHLRNACESEPRNGVVHNNLGNALLQDGRLDEAVTQFEEALRIKPDYAEARNNLGVAFLRKGQWDEAAPQFQRAIRCRPSYPEACYNLGVALAGQGKLAESVEHFQRAIQLKPDYTDACGNLAKVLATQGRFDEAVRYYRKTLELMPNSVQGHFRLGQALQAETHYAEASSEFQQTLNLDPRHLAAHTNLAWLLATCPESSVRSGTHAIELGRRAQQLSGDDPPEILDIVAAAYAEAGRFPEAVSTARQALNLARTQTNAPLAEAIQMRLKLYQSGSPFRDLAPP